MKRTLVGLVGWGVLLAIPALLVFAHVVGLGDGIRGRVAAALSTSAARVEIGRLRFSTFDGLIANDVRVFRGGGDKRLIASVDRLALSISVASLLRREVVVDALRVENGEAAIPFADDGGTPDSVNLTGIEADVTLQPGQVFISKLEARLGAVRLAVSGRLLHPEDLALPEPRADEGKAARVAAIRRGLAIFDEVKFGGTPTVTAEVAGDLADLGTLRVERARVRLGGVTYRDFSFDAVSVDGSYVDGEARLVSVVAAGDVGDLRASGRWSAETGEGFVKLSAGVKPEPVLAVLREGRGVEDVSFDGTPSVNATVRVNRADGNVAWTAVGRVETGAFRYKDVDASDLRGSFSTDGDRVFVQDLEIELPTGMVTADLLGKPGDYKLSAEIAAAPTELLSLMGPKERELLEKMEFGETPRVTVDLSGPELKFKSLTGTGRIVLGRTAMRGFFIDSGTSDLVLADRAVRYEDLDIRKGGARGTGSFTYDFGRQEVRFDGIKTNLDPPGLLMWIDPRISKTVAVYDFNRPPNTTVEGVIHMGDPSANDLTVEIDAPAGMTYRLLDRDLEFGATEGMVRVEGRRVLADLRRTTLYGGRARVKASVSIDPDQPDFSVDVALDGVDFPALTKLYFGYDRSEGKLSGTYRFDASLRNLSQMVGAGTLRVEDGHVMEIPLFGPLSAVLDQIIPGAGHENANQAELDFTVARERIATKNLEISGAGFELAGEGSVGFPSGDLDLAVRINAKGIPGIVLFPVSKLFEYESTGTVSKPDWKPKIVPKEFWDVLGMAGGSRGGANDADGAGSGREQSARGTADEALIPNDHAATPRAEPPIRRGGVPGRKR